MKTKTKTITVNFSQQEAVHLISSKIPNKITAKILTAMRTTDGGTTTRKRRLKETEDGTEHSQHLGQ